MKSQTVIEKDRDEIEITVKVRVREGGSMMEQEQAIQEALNTAGRELTRQCLESFDSDGRPLEVAGQKLTSKGQVPKNYQSPYGEVSLARHVYQSSAGGATYCPLDVSARVVNSTTPRFARMVALKYAGMKSTLARKDLKESHGREVSRCYLQETAEAVASIAEDKQPYWKYAEPELAGKVHTVAVGLDATSVLYCEEGYRMAMVGTLSLYDPLGERLHTIYVAKPPEYGKQSFLRQMEEEIAVYKKRYPLARWVGVADGAPDNWSWLERFVDTLVLDYFHAAGYLEGAATGMRRRKSEREDWLAQSADRLQHRRGGARRLLKEMQQALEGGALRGQAKEKLQTAVGYFENHLLKMNYAQCRKEHLPIGSGVTEAACKSVVKERMNGTGMRWKHSGASTVLNLRTLILSKGRWDQFWSKIARYGC